MVVGPEPVMEANHGLAALVPVTVTDTTTPSLGMVSRRHPMSSELAVSVRRTLMLWVFPFWMDVGLAVSDQPAAVPAATRRAGEMTMTDNATISARSRVGRGVRGS